MNSFSPLTCLAILLVISVLTMGLSRKSCKKEGGVCSKKRTIQDGYIEVGRCGKNSKCVRKNNIVCIGPFGNLPEAHSYFSDRGLARDLVSKITIHVGTYAGISDIITGIQLTYGSVTGPLRGGLGDSFENCTVDTSGGIFFGGVNGAAITRGNLVSLIYQLGFLNTPNQNQECLAGTDTASANRFELVPYPSSTYKLAYVEGTQINGAMLGGLTFCFETS